MNRKARSGDEQDVFGRWRHVHSWTKRAGATSRVKRGARRRERQEGKVASTFDLYEMLADEARASYDNIGPSLPEMIAEQSATDTQFARRMEAYSMVAFNLDRDKKFREDNGTAFQDAFIEAQREALAEAARQSKAFFFADMPPRSTGQEPEEQEPDYCQVCDRVLVDDDDATHDSEIAGGLVCAGCCPECARVKVV